MCKETINKYKSWKYKCRKRNLTSALSLEEYTKLRHNLLCFYTEITLVHVQNEHEKPHNAWTLDRIDSSIGYVQGNVVVCSHEANQFKNEYFEMFNAKIKEAKILQDYNMYQKIKNKLEPTQIKSVSVKKLPKLIYYV